MYRPRLHDIEVDSLNHGPAHPVGPHDPGPQANEMGDRI